MKLTVKTTQQKVFIIDIEESNTIRTLKSRIQDTQNHPIASQKIIYSGKVLADDQTIESYGIAEKDFVVLMVAKPKPTPTPTPIQAATPDVPLQPTTSDASSRAVTSDTAPQATTPDAAVQATTPDAAVQATTQDVALQAMTSDVALQTTIDNLTEMGFPRESVLRALRASFNNPDRAVEYLMNGIPAHLEGQAAGVTSAPIRAPAAIPTPPSNQPQNLFQRAQQQQAGSGAGTGAGGTGLGGGLDLAALQNSPQIAALRDQVTQNPAMIQPFLQAIAQQNPGLAQFMAQNPEAVLQLLGINVDDMAEEAIPPGAQVVSVTESERDAIERLQALGFSRQAAIEAYFACDKNEELAANYLFEGGFDD